MLCATLTCRRETEDFQTRGPDRVRHLRHAATRADMSPWMRSRLSRSSNFSRRRSAFVSYYSLHASIPPLDCPFGAPPRALWKKHTSQGTVSDFATGGGNFGFTHIRRIIVAFSTPNVSPKSLYRYQVGLRAGHAMPYAHARQCYAKRSEDVAAACVSPLKYKQFKCKQLVQEVETLTSLAFIWDLIRQCIRG
jgi:hypothetical protein